MERADLRFVRIEMEKGRKTGKRKGRPPAIIHALPIKPKVGLHVRDSQDSFLPLGLFFFIFFLCAYFIVFSIRCLNDF